MKTRIASKNASVAMDGWHPLLVVRVWLCAWRLARLVRDMDPAEVDALVEQMQAELGSRNVTTQEGGSDGDR